MSEQNNTERRENRDLRNRINDAMKRENEIRDGGSPKKKED